MNMIINMLLLLFLIIAAIGIGRQRNLFASTMQMGIFSLLSASVFLCMDAVDVALTEAAVGAGIVTLLFLSTLAQTSYKEHTGLRNQFPALLITVATGLLLIYGLQDMPAFGSGAAPVHQWISPDYLRGTQEQIGIPNGVTAVLASYRGYDTLGEVVVIFTSLIGTLMLLGRGKSRSPKN